jgi:magnesium-transporting ATPase (P-type)
MQFSQAVEEGRTIYANITKFVFFLLSTNISEVFLILIAVLAGLESPLEPIQILWMNLVGSSMLVCLCFSSSHLISLSNRRPMVSLLLLWLWRW